LMDEMSAINTEIRRPIHFMVVGPSEANRIASVVSNFNATIVTSRPFQAALHGEQANVVLEFEENREASREYLFKWNIDQFDSHCENRCRYNEGAKHVSSRSNKVDSTQLRGAIKATPSHQAYCRKHK